MKKVKSKFRKKLIISLCFLAVGIGIASYIGNLFLSPNIPITGITTNTTKITGYNGTIEQAIIDNSNNLYFTNYDEKEENTAVYKLKTDSITAIKLINTPVVKVSEHQKTNFSIKLDKNNNLYVKQDNIYDKKWFKIEHDTTSAIELNITGIDNKIIDNIWFDKDNNLFFHYRTTSNHYFYKLEHDTTNAVEITALTAHRSRIEKIQFDSENNLWIEMLMGSRYENKKWFKVEHDTTDAVELNITGIDNDMIYKLWFDKDNNMFILYSKDNNRVFYRVERDTTNAVEITGFKGDINNFIIDNENNLWLSNNFNGLYVIKNNTTNAIKIMDIIHATNFIINNNNLYFSATAEQDKIYLIKPNTFIANEIETRKEVKLLVAFWFDNNNLFFITNDSQIFKTINFIK